MLSSGVAHALEVVQNEEHGEQVLDFLRAAQGGDDLLKMSGVEAVGFVLDLADLESEIRITREERLGQDADAAAQRVEVGAVREALHRGPIAQVLDLAANIDGEVGDALEVAGDHVQRADRVGLTLVLDRGAAEQGEAVVFDHALLGVDVLLGALDGLDDAGVRRVEQQRGVVELLFDLHEHEAEVGFDFLERAHACDP